MSSATRQWHYVISPLGKCAWVDNGEPAPPWVSEACWYGAVAARTLTEARALVEGLRQTRAQRVRDILDSRS